MATYDTKISQVSAYSQKIISEVATKSKNSLLRMQLPNAGEELFHRTWEALGKHISTKMRQGRGVIVPGFGEFTFCAIGVNLDGVTNPKQRDLGQRQPVFLVSKNFVNGGGLKTGKFCPEYGIVRPFAAHGTNGIMHSTKCNFTQIGMFSGLSKDDAKVGVDRVIKQLAQDVRSKGRCEMIIPSIGVFSVHNRIASVAFDEGLSNDAQIISNKNYTSISRKKKAQKFITEDVMDKYSLSQSGYDTHDYEGRFMTVSNDVLEVLRNSYGIDAGALPEVREFRPKTATANYDHLSISQRKKNKSRVSNSQRSSRSNTDLLGLNSSASRMNYSRRPGDISQFTTNFLKENKPKTVQLNNDRLSCIAKRKLGLWIREKRTPIMDSFFEIIARELGRDVVRTIQVDVDLFARCIHLLGIGVDLESARVLAEQVNNGAKLTADKYVEFMADDNYDDLNKLRDVIYLNNLQFDDILKTMNISNKSALIDFFMLRDGLRRMNPGLNFENAKLLSAKIMNGRNQITIYDFIEVMEGITAENGQQELEYNRKLLNKIRLKLLSHTDPNILRKEFEEADTLNNGLLDPANFKGCLLKLRSLLDLTIGEINKIGRYVDKVDGLMINYVNFLKMLDSELIKLSLRSVDSLNRESLFDIENLALDIKGYLKQRNISIYKFLLEGNGKSCEGYGEEELRHMRTEMRLDKFIRLIVDCLYSDGEVEETTVAYYASKIDIDKDGMINTQDLKTFLERYDLIEGKNEKLAETLFNTMYIDATKELEVPLKKELYPEKEVDEKKIDVVLRDLRQAISSRNISFRELFYKLDLNKDGIITYDEFKDGLKSIIEYSEPIVKGLFAYMDRQKIGMVDFNGYLRVMKKSVLDKLSEGPEDNFDWQINVIEEIKKWYYSENISSEDAFRMIDTDFDQKINKVDLNRFIKDVLLIPEEEITSPRIDRLFNLLDQYKRGRILYEDFKRILSDDFEPSDNLSITAGKKCEKHSFDWLLNARQKIGLYISKNYSDMKACFDEISKQCDSITYDKFKKWLEPRGILLGFNLTENLLRILFSDLDPHKKGHLIENDWRNTFAGYDHCKVSLLELKDLLMSNFTSPHDAFIFFSQHGPNSNAINFDCFGRSLDSLLPNRFSGSGKKKLWNTLTGNSVIMERRHFISLFEGDHFNGSVSLVPKSMRRSQTQAPRPRTGKTYTTKLASIEPSNTDVISIVREFINASKLTIKQVFQKIDQSGTGTVTNLEFKEGIRKLQIGLTSRQIDELINCVDMNKDGRVDWIEFAGRFKEKNSDWRILDRTRQRLHWIKDKIYIFMLSPKDAFRSFNHDNSGTMTFQHFNNFLKTICEMSGEEPFSFVLTKDLFNYFDARKDGLIDVNEWMQVFKRIEVPIKSKHLQHIVLNPNGAEISKFENSSEFDIVVRTIAKNRKFLLSQFQQIESRRVLISFKVTKLILDKLFRSLSLKLPDRCWPLIISFAEKDGVVNYRYLLDRYKQRTQNHNTFPTA